MKVGIKLWSSNPPEYVEKAGFTDFIEVMPVSLESVEKFANTNYEYTIHVPHESFGFNPLLDREKSQSLLQFAVNSAKKLRAELLVMHTGYFSHSPSKAEVANAIAAVAELVKSNPYGKTLIENSTSSEACPEDKGKHYFCYEYDELKMLLEQCNAGFCLDLEHAAFTAHSLGISYEEHVNSLMRLKPEYFHLSGARLSNVDASGKTHHLSIFEGDIDLKFVKELLKKEKKPVCLETPIDIEQRRREVEFLKK